MRVHELMYEMANIQARDTKLKHIIFVSTQAGPRDTSNRHGPRVKIEYQGVRYPIMFSERSAPSTVSDVRYPFDSAELKDVLRWVDFNKPALMDFWNEKIDFPTLRARLVDANYRPIARFQPKNP